LWPGPEYRFGAIGECWPFELRRKPIDQRLGDGSSGLILILVAI
jgi:hypothetical protein